MKHINILRAYNKEFMLNYMARKVTTLFTEFDMYVYYMVWNGRTNRNTAECERKRISRGADGIWTVCRWNTRHWCSSELCGIWRADSVFMKHKQNTRSWPSVRLLPSSLYIYIYMYVYMYVYIHTYMYIYIVLSIIRFADYTRMIVKLLITKNEGGK